MQQAFKEYHEEQCAEGFLNIRIIRELSAQGYILVQVVRHSYSPRNNHLIKTEFQYIFERDMMPNSLKPGYKDLIGTTTAALL